MANINCEACADLREASPELVVNGFTEDMCTSLSNDTGLSPSSGNDDCTDLNNMNDCLVGNLDAEVEAYDVCEWKPFMHKFIPNVWTTLKGIICAICGLWKNIHNIWCFLNAMANGKTFTINEDPDEGSYVVAGKGISFFKASPDGTGHITDVTLTYIAGGLVQGKGSLIWHTENFTDAKACVNFDNGSTERTSTSRLGNPNLGPVGRPATGGELLYEIRIKKSQYPQIKNLYTGFGQETAGGAYTVEVLVFQAGSYAYGNHGWCDTSTGEASSSGYDNGHKVPSGWLYVQVRLNHCSLANSDGIQRSPLYFIGARLNQNGIDC